MYGQFSFCFLFLFVVFNAMLFYSILTACCTAWKKRKRERIIFFYWFLHLLISYIHSLFFFPFLTCAFIYFIMFLFTCSFIYTLGPPSRPSSQPLCSPRQRCVVVQEVFPDGLVAQDGRLQPGDQIIEVDGVDMTLATHQTVCQALRRPQAVLRLGVYRERIEAQRTLSPSSTGAAPDSTSHHVQPGGL